MAGASGGSEGGGWFQGAGNAILAGGIAGVNWLSGQASANKQYHANKKLARRQHHYNMELLKYQLAYNTPAAQMERFKQAGLNPNLVYGQGSAGNMESAPRYPEQQPVDYSFMANLGTRFMEAKLMASQANLTDTKVEESTVKQDLMNAQKNVAQANPWMKSEYVNNVVLQLKSAAKLKEQEMMFMTQGMVTEGKYQGEAGMVKMRYELEQLEQRFKLNEADQKVKAEIVKSKDFQNAILEVQKKWMTEKEITPQHIYQGIMLLLSKMM